ARRPGTRAARRNAAKKRPLHGAADLDRRPAHRRQRRVARSGRFRTTRQTTGKGDMNDHTHDKTRDATQPGAEAAAAQASFQIEKLYIKDLSLEVPNAPQIFMQVHNPQLEIQVRNEAAQFAEGMFEVTVTV